MSCYTHFQTMAVLLPSLFQTCTSWPRNHVKPPPQLLSRLGNVYISYRMTACGSDSWLTPVSVNPPRLHACCFYIICYQNAIPTEIIEGSILIFVFVPMVLYGMGCVTLASPLMQKCIRVFLQLNSTAFCSRRLQVSASHVWYFS